MRFAGQGLANAGIDITKLQGFDPVQPPPLPKAPAAVPAPVAPTGVAPKPVQVAGLIDLSSDHVGALAEGGASGNAGRTLGGYKKGAGFGGGGGSPLGSEQLEDHYLGEDDSDFGTYDPAMRSFFPGV